MGAARRHRRDFLFQNPKCAFCGGGVVATTIEHCPPRALFQHRQWPEGFEFPACAACNNDTADDDLLVALLARMDPFENRGDLDGRSAGLIAAAHQQFPDLLRNMMPTANEARRNNKELGIRPKPGLTHQQAGVVHVTNEMRSAVSTFATKLAKAIFYREAGMIFPSSGCLLMTWFTNADLLQDGKYPVFDALAHVAGQEPPLVRAGRFLNDQFGYKFSLSPEKSVFVLQARFGNSFGFVVFGSTIQGMLERQLQEIAEASPREDGGPFVVLQSLHA